MAGREIGAAEWRELIERRWSEEDARRVLAAWRESGDSAYAFAREHGLNAQRLGWWSKRLGDWEPADEVDGFVRADVIATPRSTPSSAPVVVHASSGVVIEVEPTRVDATWLAALLLELDRGES
jgi:transposase-like protein